MYRKVFKNNQINLGTPFQIRTPMDLQLVRPLNTPHPVEEELELVRPQKSVEDITQIAEDIINRANEEAELIIKEAHFEAARIMDEAQVQAEELKTASVEDGKKLGYEEGIVEAQRQYEDMVRQAEEIKNNAIIEYSQVLKGIETDAVNMVMEIAKKVISDEISINKENILFLVKQAFEKCSNKDDVTLKVSPEDYEFMVANKDRMLSLIEGIGEIEIKKEGSLKAGSCIIETPFGSVDAGVQTKLKKIEETFKQLTGKYQEG